MSVTLAAAKVIFYSYLCLQNHENVEIVTNSPTRCETVIDTKKLKLPTNSSYYNVLKKDNGYDFIFRSGMYWHGGSTSLYNTKTGRLTPIIRNAYYVNHNFCVFRSECDTKYYGVGGEHSVDHIARCKRDNNKIYSEPMIRHGDADIVSPDVYSKYHHNGLYLMQSTDMIHWEYAHKLPIISGVHPGQTDDWWGYSKLDSKISCFYSERLRQYVLFIRANMGQGCRWIQTTRSKDLIHWEPFQLLRMNGVSFEKDNYYHLDVMEYPDAGVFVGLSPYTNEKQDPTEVCIKLMFSKDGVHWIDRGGILDTPTSADGLRNSTHTTGVFFDRGAHYDVFFNENYNGLLNSKKSVTVVRYEIPKDRLVGVKSNGVGRFSFDIGVRSDQMVLNYDCHEDGYLRLSMNEEEFILHGDDLNKVVVIDSKYIGQDVRVNVEMKNCILYSCTS